ncbi:hypothetical protein SDJN03_05245, partial [Cucurbita argyrosperma subsp. sororia]
MRIGHVRESDPIPTSLNSSILLLLLDASLRRSPALPSPFSDPTSPPPSSLAFRLLRPLIPSRSDSLLRFSDSSNSPSRILFPASSPSFYRGVF